MSWNCQVTEPPTGTVTVAAAKLMLTTLTVAPPPAGRGTRWRSTEPGRARRPAGPRPRRREIMLGTLDPGCYSGNASRSRSIRPSRSASISDRVSRPQELGESPRRVEDLHLHVLGVRASVAARSGSRTAVGRTRTRTSSTLRSSPPTPPEAPMVPSGSPVTASCSTSNPARRTGARSVDAGEEPQVGVVQHAATVVAEQPDGHPERAGTSARSSAPTGSAARRGAAPGASPAAHPPVGAGAR